MAPKVKRTHPFVKYGLPLVLLVVGGYVGLTQFVTNKYEALDARVRRRSERSMNMELEREKLLKEFSVTSEYEIKPIPRPASDDEEGGVGPSAVLAVPAKPAPAAKGPELR